MQVLVYCGGRRGQRRCVNPAQALGPARPPPARADADARDDVHEYGHGRPARALHARLESALGP